MSKKNVIHATKEDVTNLLDASLENGSLEGFVFEPEVARRAFDHFDKDRSGNLERREVLKLADKLWNTFYPQGPVLDEEGKVLLAGEIIKTVDADGNTILSYDEFLPWFKKMNEKFYIITHPKPKVSPEAAKASRVKLGAGAPPTTNSVSPSSVSSGLGGSDFDAPPIKADMEPIRARLEDLRSSIEAFGSMLDSRLDNWLQTIESYGEQIKGTQGVTGVGVV